MKNILVFFEIEFGPQDIMTAECQLTFALVVLKTGNVMPCLEYMQKAQMFFSNNLGEFDRKTKEVDALIRKVENIIKQN